MCSRSQIEDMSATKTYTRHHTREVCVLLKTADGNLPRRCVFLITPHGHKPSRFVLFRHTHLDLHRSKMAHQIPYEAKTGRV